MAACHGVMRTRNVFSVNEQTALAREFPNVELLIIDGIGHTLHWERPQRFVDELLSFAH